MVWLVVGLGNPGAEYKNTRHNIGHMVVDEMARVNSLTWSSHKARADVAAYKLGNLTTVSLDSPGIVLAKSHSYMNETGGPIKALCNFYKVSTDNLIVIHDELDIPFNTIRIKQGGGDNGHNGLKSTTSALGAEYFRIRMGIGRPNGQQDPADFVLKNFASAEKLELPGFISRGGDAIEFLIKHGLTAAQGIYNQ
jgi:PTH1 family peptidyl-tRNA hydrolase